MELFHGSTGIISKPSYGGGKAYNDYGQGFYCTQVTELAMEWACREGSDDAFINIYSIDTDNLSILSLNSPSFNILNWLAILVENRSGDYFAGFNSESRKILLDWYLPDYKSADIIVGYRADDSYFSFAKAFLKGSISLRQLSVAMRLGKLGEQVCIKSRRAFDELLFIGYGSVPVSEYLPKKQARDLEARKQYAGLSSEASFAEDIYWIDIIRQNWTNNDPRLF